MPSTFSFSADTLVTPTYLKLSDLTPGFASGVNDTSQSSAVATGQAIDDGGDIDVFAVTLQAGQSYTFDIDDGAGDFSGGSVDLELDLIDQSGHIVLNDDGSPTLDTGSVSTLDPGIRVDVNQTGTYFIAVHAQDAEYIDGTYGFDDGGSADTGDYRLVVSASGLPASIRLGPGNSDLQFGEARQNVAGGDGNDTLRMGGGSDVVDGDAGADKLLGEGGDDELAGSQGADLVSGGSGDDVLLGQAGRDVLGGGLNDDALSGGGGDDAMSGGNGDDILWGEGQDDSLSGGDGNDLLRGGMGVDRMSGDAGADTFHFLPGESNFTPDVLHEDEILGFQDQDRIDLTDLRIGLLTWRGSAGFSGANQVRVVDYREDDGDGFQEVRVNLDSNTSTIELAFLVNTEGNFDIDSRDFLL